MCITQGELYCNGVQLAYSKGLLRIPEKKPENLPCPPSPEAEAINIQGCLRTVFKLFIVLTRQDRRK